MMMQGMHRDTLVERLLNTLEAERYMRGPLLLTIVDELCVSEAFAGAAEDARAILEGLESGMLVESEFASRVGALRRLVQALSVA